jgi:hypothetical protein
VYDLVLGSIENGVVDRQHGRDGNYLFGAFVPEDKSYTERKIKSQNDKQKLPKKKKSMQTQYHVGPSRKPRLHLASNLELQGLEICPLGTSM